MTFDDVTLLVWLSQWPVLLGRELWCIWKRGHHAPDEPIPKTISMVAQARGWHVSWVIYLDAGLPVHYWVNWTHPVWSTPIPGIVFWAIPVGLLAWNLSWWGKPREAFPAWAKWALWPPLVMVLGAVSAYCLFPQRGPMPWSP